MKNDDPIKTFTPILPSFWEHFIGVVPIEFEDDMQWAEDLFSSRWKEWEIWLDGGKGISVWQCSLVEPQESNDEGVLEHDHYYAMRDFLDTSEQVQAWLDRAVEVAARWEKQRT